MYGVEDKMVEQLFEFLKKNAEKNKETLPKVEDFPIVEHTILAIYNQTHAITLLGLPTSSLIMQGVLMEMFVKFFYYHHKKQDFKGELKDLIKCCFDENLFSKDKERNKQYYVFFDNFRDRIRNTQVHFLTQKQTRGLSALVKKISVPNNADGTINKDEMEKAMKEAPQKIFEEGEFLSTSENPAIANVLKFKMDEEIYLEQFCELNKVILALNKEHNLDYKQK